jgi:hypothetical protein
MVSPHPSLTAYAAGSINVVAEHQCARNHWKHVVHCPRVTEQFGWLAFWDDSATHVA